MPQLQETTMAATQQPARGDLLSLTTDFQTDTGCPEPSLRAIAEAGFTHVHWCHHWNTDFLYSRPEISQIAQWLSEAGLKLLDLHGSAGQEKCWYSLRESERLAGVELVQNRLEMTAELGGVSVVMHIPKLPEGAETTPQCDQLRRSIDALLPAVRGLGVRLALENMANEDFRFLRKLLSEYGADAVGICYDCGHGNMDQRRGLDHIDTVKDRLIAVHLHDNDGIRDQHWVPFTGTVDFARLAGILARSSYRGCISMESNLKNVADFAKPTFLADARQAGRRLTEMVASAMG
jgi:sugar phosphate isomerase/epimerase